MPTLTGTLSERLAARELHHCRLLLYDCRWHLFPSGKYWEALTDDEKALIGKLDRKIDDLRQLLED